MPALPLKADICSAKSHVRFTPESGRARRRDKAHGRGYAASREEAMAAFKYAWRA
jgi:hypothetical protein